ncbi:MAG: hypothetical protein LBH62_00955 [Nitrososphaerota archaeon]|nr:hypothetical protein [Nitrososphaerota archaeon]
MSIDRRIIGYWTYGAFRTVSEYTFRDDGTFLYCNNSSGTIRRGTYTVSGNILSLFNVNGVLYSRQEFSLNGDRLTFPLDEGDTITFNRS